MRSDPKVFYQWTKLGEATGKYLCFMIQRSDLQDRICRAAELRFERLRFLGLDVPEIDEQSRSRIKFELIAYLLFTAREMTLQATTGRRGFFGEKRDYVSWKGCLVEIERNLSLLVQEQRLDKVEYYLAERVPADPLASITYQSTAATGLKERVDSYYQAQQAERELGVPFGVGEKVLGLCLAYAVRSPRVEEIGAVAEAFAPELVQTVGYVLGCALAGKEPENFTDEKSLRTTNAYDDFPYA